MGNATVDAREGSGGGGSEGAGTAGNEVRPLAARGSGGGFALRAGTAGSRRLAGTPVGGGIGVAGALVPQSDELAPWVPVGLDALCELESRGRVPEPSSDRASSGMEENVSRERLEKRSTWNLW